MSTNAVRKIPRGEQRRKELVDIAENIFLELGYADTTMRTIAERAGASKETLYRHFASKELLFAEIVKRKAAEINGPNAAVTRGGLPKFVLTELALGLLHHILSNQSTSLLRMVVTEAGRTQELGEMFYRLGPGSTVDRLVVYLKGAVKRGELDCDQPLMAARVFLGAVVSHFHFQCLIQAGPNRPSERQIRQHVQTVVDMFLARYGRMEGEAG
ncbi:MAG: TetR/AcrR family transcriptional regulator [Tardiphaga sp.]